MKKDKFQRHPIKAVFAFIGYFLLLVVFVYFGIRTLLNQYPDFSYMFNNTITYAVYIGTPVSVLAGLTGYFDKGEIYRLLFGEGRVALMILYIIIITGSIFLGYKEQGASFEITVPTIILLIIVGLILRGLFYLLEFYTYKDKEENVPEEHPEKKENTSYY